MSLIVVDFCSFYENICYDRWYIHKYVAQLILWSQTNPFKIGLFAENLHRAFKDAVIELTLYS